MLKERGVGIALREVAEGDGTGIETFGLNEIFDGVLQGHVGEHDAVSLRLVYLSVPHVLLQNIVRVVGFDKEVVDTSDGHGNLVGIGGKKEDAGQWVFNQKTQTWNIMSH